MKINLDEVLETVIGELEYQDTMTKNVERTDIIEDVHLGDALSIIQYNLDLARKFWYKNSKPHPKSMDYLRKIAATCVKMGVINGMPKRMLPIDEPTVFDWKSWHELPNDNSHIVIEWNNKTYDKFYFTRKTYSMMNFTTLVPLRWRYLKVVTKK